jgi:heme/copper-type cytochrome/quinol oxidase subunit 3
MGLWKKYREWGNKMHNKRLAHQKVSNSDENQLKISEAMYLGLAVSFFIILIDLLFELLKNRLNIETTIGALTFKLVAVLILLALYGVAYNELKSKNKI